MSRIVFDRGEIEELIKLLGNKNRVVSMSVSTQPHDLFQSHGILDRMSAKIIIKVYVSVLLPFFDLLGPGLQLCF